MFGRAITGVRQLMTTAARAAESTAKAGSGSMQGKITQTSNNSTRGPATNGTGGAQGGNGTTNGTVTSAIRGNHGNSGNNGNSSQNQS